MNTIVCYIDYPGRYQSDVNYASRTIECEYMLLTKHHGHRGETGEVFSCTLDTLLRNICRLLEKKQRYRVITNNARLAILNSDLQDQLESGQIEYRTTNGEWVNKETGSIEKVCSVIHVTSPKVSIACLEHVATKAEVTILDTSNYGIVWQESVLPDRKDFEEPNDRESFILKLSSAIKGDGITILSLVISKYEHVCRKHKLGKPAMTTASQGMESHRWRKGAYRFRQTTCPKALQLEIEGHHGGVQLPFGYGHYNGECHMYDISSFYPHLATITKVPVKHVATHDRPTINDFATIADGSYCIAKADIAADGYYPLRSGFETIYPNGCTITTVLHHCELQRALVCGHVQSVHSIGEYECEYALRDNCQHLLSIRTAAERCGDKLTAHWAKQIAVGYWGKIGSKLSCWQDTPDIFDVDGKQTWVESQHGSGHIRNYRSLFGRVQRKRDDLVNSYGSIAAAGALTAYGRERLWALVALAGRENVLYVSTDSIIVNSVGNRRLYPYVELSQFKPGSIRKIQSAYNCIIAGTGIYAIGKRFARQGYSKESNGNDEVTWTELPDTYEDVIDRAANVPFRFHHNESKEESRNGDVIESERERCGKATQATLGFGDDSV